MAMAAQAKANGTMAQAGTIANTLGPPVLASVLVLGVFSALI